MWEKVADRMLSLGCQAKWPKDECRKKWVAVNPGDAYLANYGFPLEYRDSNLWEASDELYPDGRASLSHSLPETTAMGEVRSRAASDASSQMLHMRHQQRQQQLLFDQQQRHNGWEVED